MRVWIFSDLHLASPHSSLYQSFLKVLEEPKQKDDIVVLAGDIFDLWVGDSDVFRSKYQAFLSQIENSIRHGVKVFYIEGNHDFHLKHALPNEVEFQKEAVVLEDLNAKKKIYIAHGDLVDTEDKSYLRLRGFLRSPLMEFLCEHAPGRLIEVIGEASSRPLEKKMADLPEYWPSEKLANLRTKYRQFAKSKHLEGYDYIVLGHCHDFDQVEPYYFNMGYPEVHGQYLFYESQSTGQASLFRKSF